jgi:hypothetical protein
VSADRCEHGKWDFECRDCAVAEGAADERAAIVADLREAAAALDRDPQGVPVASMAMAHALRKAANRYERVEHITPTREPEGTPVRCSPMRHMYLRSSMTTKCPQCGSRSTEGP